MGILRLLLALLVVNSHMYDARFPTLLGGGDAVSIFFAISGFYMALILNGKYAKNADFYINRYLRLYPSYAVVLVASIAWFGFLTVYTQQKPPPFWIYQVGHQMAWWQYAFLQFSNLTMIGLDVPSLFHWSAQKGFLFLHFAAGDTSPDGAFWGGYLPWIRQAWSVGAEIWFYVLAPFLLRRHWTLQLSVAVASIAISITMSSMGLMTYYFFPANLWLFLTGSLLFVAYPTIKKLGRRLAWPALGGIVLIFAFGGLVQNYAVHWVLLLLVIASVPLLFAQFSSSTLDNAIGELSYPVYLLHLLLIAVLKTVAHLENTIVACLATITVALVLVRFIEEPMNRFRQRRYQNAAAGNIPSFSLTTFVIEKN